VQLDWTTFALEIVNFLILVWILKRFLYQPVMDVIARRRAAIAQRLADADARLAQAKDLEQQYQERLTDWKREKDKAQTTLRGELDRERARLMDELKVELGQERDKAHVLEARRTEELRRHLESEALVVGGRFAARLFERLASAELEARIIDMTCEDLGELADAQRDALQAALRSAGGVVVVTSAYKLPDARRTALTTALKNAAGAALSDMTLTEDRTLLAGVRIEIGSWVLRASLRDELAFFTEVTHERDVGTAS
jgi:F-type H+-transporting ATPase subunit b